MIVDDEIVDSGTEPLVLAGDVEPIVIGASQAASGDGTADNLTGFFDGEIDGITIHDEPVNAVLVPCFTKGTLIATPGGKVPVETLRVGDLVCTLHRGPQPIRWIGSTAVGFGKDADSDDRRRPVRISAGALGRGLPTRDLLVSRQHRMLVSSRIAARMFEDGNALVAAIKLTELPGICIDDSLETIAYFHVLFDRHEVITAEDAPAESLFPGRQAMKAFSPEARQEILAIFPRLRAGNWLPAPASTIPAGQLQQKLVARHAKHQKPILETFAPPATVERPLAELQQ